MLIKPIDERNSDITILNKLLEHPGINAGVRQKIEREIKQIRAGVKGENDAAYEIEFYLKDGKNYATIHDLRVEHNGRVAQIDHIIIDRFLNIWVCESKHFSSGIAINEHGECTTFYAGKAHGIASPIEQNKKHCDVLNKIFQDNVIEPQKRLGFTITPKIFSLILISNNARISRPKLKVDGLDTIIKAEKIFDKIQSDQDKQGASVIAKVISSETLKDFAERIVALHKPIPYDWRAKFGISDSSNNTAKLQPHTSVTDDSNHRCASCGVSVSEKVAKYCAANNELFNEKIYCRDCQGKIQSSDNNICTSCGKTVSSKVADFCKSNPSKFNNKIYCYDCQNKHAPRSKGQTQPSMQNRAKEHQPV